MIFRRKYAGDSNPVNDRDACSLSVEINSKTVNALLEEVKIREISFTKEINELRSVLQANGIDVRHIKTHGANHSDIRCKIYRYESTLR